MSLVRCLAISQSFMRWKSFNMLSKFEWSIFSNLLYNVCWLINVTTYNFPVEVLSTFLTTSNLYKIGARLPRFWQNFKDLSCPIKKYNFDSNSLMGLVIIWSQMYINHPLDQTPISSKIDPKLMLYRPLAKVELTPI